MKVEIKYLDINSIGMKILFNFLKINNVYNKFIRCMDLKGKVSSPLFGDPVMIYPLYNIYEKTTYITFNKISSLQIILNLVLGDRELLQKWNIVLFNLIGEDKLKQMILSSYNIAHFANKAYYVDMYKLFYKNPNLTINDILELSIKNIKTWGYYCPTTLFGDSRILSIVESKKNLNKKQIKQYNEYGWIVSYTIGMDVYNKILNELTNMFCASQIYDTDIKK